MQHHHHRRIHLKRKRRLPRPSEHSEQTPVLAQTPASQQAEQLQAHQTNDAH